MPLDRALGLADGLGGGLRKATVTVVVAILATTGSMLISLEGVVLRLRVHLLVDLLPPRHGGCDLRVRQFLADEVLVCVRFSRLS